MIPNHIAPKLSELDIQMAITIPPGGNWKNIPEDIPSKRLDNIRRSFAEGKGSRSTYYGRLTHDKPAYTITTCFARPGNGCNLHFDFTNGQHRVLTYREAARLQSFPDSFVFQGSKTSICKQIGNAVPPLLAYRIALQLGKPGRFIDLFAGAGGLSLGFIWAGWKPIIANDIDKTFLKTYQANIHNEVVCGDIRDPSVSKTIIDTAKSKSKVSHRLAILGGPPCQGFSNAGNKRSMDDDRNHLYKNYLKIVKETNPDLFIFENVTGLINMEKGKILSRIIKQLNTVTGKVTFNKFYAEQHAVPQRRTRMILVGKKDGTDFIPPSAICCLNSETGLRNCVSVKDALSDLPDLKSGEDGSDREYKQTPTNPYQKFMRGIISAKQFIENYD
ncbi:DNA cytosine methyltransferase [Candidatus Woesearchaeota archaeon]|nr:DNA cytosine methyltransferase [Candidatus Woesearchaeota archaeon]